MGIDFEREWFLGIFIRGVLNLNGSDRFLLVERLPSQHFYNLRTNSAVF